MSELDGLKELLVLLIDETTKKLERIAEHMMLVTTVEEVLEREIETKTIIQVKKVITKNAANLQKWLRF